MMNIHGLDDPSLLVIFDQLSVEDLLRAGRVCSRWNFIRHKCALSRHSLTLLVGEHARDRVDNSKLDNIPYGQLLTDDYGMPLVHVKECADARNEIVRNKISSLNAKFLAHLFPNITNFTVSIKSDIKSVHSLVYLLKLWSTNPKLTTLKLYTYDPRDKVDLPDKIDRILVSANRRLLSTINSITSLRVLLFDIDSMLFCVKSQMYVGDVKLEFPMLNQLESLHLHSHDINWEGDKLVNILTRFVNENDNLKQIGICAEHVLKQNDNTTKMSLARQFTQMNLEIDDNNISLFSGFCEGFSNLTSLQLNLTAYKVEFGPFEFYPPINSLAQLINLTINADISNLVALDIVCDNNNCMDTFCRLNRASPVKVLTLKVTTDRLDEDDPLDFESLRLSHLFPNVQVFLFELIEDEVTVGDWNMRQIRESLLWCAHRFENIKIIQSLNPDKEWSIKEIEDLEGTDDDDRLSDQVTDDDDQEVDDENANE